MARARKVTPASARITVVAYIAPGNALMPKCLQSLVGQSLSHDEYDILLLAGSESVAIYCTEAELSAISNLQWYREPVTDRWAAWRTALDLSRTPMLALMDPDATAHRDWLAAYLQTFEAYGKAVSLVAGPVRPVWSVPRPAWLGDDLLREMSLVDLGAEARFLAPGEYISAANFAVRTTSITAIDGFASDFSAFPILDDDALTLAERVRASTGRLVYDPAACVEYPVVSARLKQSWFRRRAAWRAVNSALQTAYSDTVEATERWRRVKDFIFEAPPADRSVRALVLDQTDPIRFQGQVAAIGNLLRCLLDGVGEQDND